MDIEKTIYKLQSYTSGRLFEDTGWLLEEPDALKPGLIRAVYSKRQIDVRAEEYGLYRFADWLPVNKMLKGSSAPFTYKSKSLADILSLKNLYITYSGYWPERGGKMPTCSFKETEAYSVCARMNSSTDRILVVASAGNTARAFARVCSDNNIPLLLCVPEDYIDVLWFDEPINDNVKLISSRSGSDYFDSIYLSNLACELEPFIAEGGAKNVARRDGMGTTVLSAATTIGRIPDYYFQAIGSGTGAIAAWEANLRLIDDGRFGNHKMKLMVSQNYPFMPIYDAWNAGSRDLFPFDEDQARKKVEQIMAKVLSNRKPPYGIPGGLYDAMNDAGGEVLIATNQEAERAAHLFLESEGIDIHPAAAVATASLVNAVYDGKVEKDAVIMLNITGGGEERFIHDYPLHFLSPSVIFDINPDRNEVKEKLLSLF